MNSAFLFFPAVFFGAIFWLEAVCPHRVRPMDRRRHALTNGAIALIAAGINIVFMELAIFPAMAWHQRQAVGILHGGGMAGPAKALAAVVLFDLWMYIWHRWNHRARPLWRLHRAHHNDVNMDVTTALRFHPVEIFLSCVFNTGIVALLGMSREQFLGYNLLLQIVIFFHHSNVGLPERWDRRLRALLVTPNMHRVHHSVETFETDSNYGSVFSFWDRMFLTFRKRDDTKAVTFGLADFREDRWQGLAGFLGIPFLREV